LLAGEDYFAEEERQLTFGNDIFEAAVTSSPTSAPVSLSALYDNSAAQPLQLLA
jgi:hypothetical protein